VEHRLHLVADYGPDDGLFVRFSRCLALAEPRIEVVLARVPPCDTVAAGYCVAHLALTPRAGARVVVHDVAAPDGAGAAARPIWIGRSAAGATVLGPNAGHAWSFVAGHLSGLRCVEVPAGSPHCGPERMAAAVVRALRCHPHGVCGAARRGEIPPPPTTAATLTAEVERLATRLTSPCEPNGLARRSPLGSPPSPGPAAAGASFATTGSPGPCAPRGTTYWRSP
jgi:hypothetical protein